MTLNINQVEKAGNINQSEQGDNSAVAQELRQISDTKDLLKQLNIKAHDNAKTDAKRLDNISHERSYQAKLNRDPGTKVLAHLASDLAELGIDMSPRKSTNAKIDEDLKQIEKRAMKEDKFEIRNNLTREAIQRAQGKDEQKKEQTKKEEAKQKASTPEVKEAMQQYSSAYAQFAISSSPEAKEKMDSAESKLKKSGFSDGDINSMERSVKRAFKSDFVSDIQHSFIQHMFSQQNTFDFVVSKRQLNNSLGSALKNEAVSGISSEPEALKGQVDDIAQASYAEIKDFVKEAVESTLMERHLSGKENKEELRRMVELGAKVGFNFNSFIKTWEQKKFNLGLFVIEVGNAAKAENQGEIVIGGVSAGEVGDKTGYEMTKDEEKELLINQLRAECMKRALTGDPFAVFSFAPKIRKLKNGLIKLGLENQDIENIEKEARVLARYRTMEMLRDAFVERATYYELSGPAYSLLSNKIKGLVANLDNLGMTLTKDQLDMLRDDANRMMHDHTIIELKSAVALIESHENPALKEKIPLMVKLIQRLKAESGFSHDIGEDLDEIMYRHDNNQLEVKEDA